MSSISSSVALTVCVLLASSYHLAGAFKWPLKPTDYCTRYVQERTERNCESKVYVHVNKLDSVNTLVPYEYSSFDFCGPGNNSDPVENLGQVVFGERLRASGYDISFAESSWGNWGNKWLLCTLKYSKEHDKKKVKFLYDRIHENYMQQWVIDNMPVTWCYSILDGEQPYCTTRFPVGCYVTQEGVRHNACYLSDKFSEKGATYIFNHVHIIISYHEGTEKADHTDGRVVRARVMLNSCDDLYCTKPMKVPDPEKFETLEIPYFYSVEFKAMASLNWINRWDYILNVPDISAKVQWFCVLNAFIFSLFLTATLCFVLCRSLHKDGKQYSPDDNAKNVPRQFRWRLVHADVFRPPGGRLLLAVFVGSGMQIFCTAFCVLVLYFVNLLSPTVRGAHETAILVFYVLFSGVAGYVSARQYKSFGGERYKTAAVMTALLVPGIVFTIFFVLNLLLWGAKSSDAIPFTTLLALLCLWFGISLPLTFFGSFLGFRRLVKQPPVVTNTIPRQIPSRWYMCPNLCTFVSAGVMLVVFSTHLVTFMDSVWYISGSYYKLSGFVLLNFLLLLSVCIQLPIILIHNYLWFEDYHWWWRSFFTTAISGFYLFLLSIYFLVDKMSLTGALSYFLYFGYGIIVAFLFSLMTGAVGFLSTYFFVRRLYRYMEQVEDLSTVAICSGVTLAESKFDAEGSKGSDYTATPTGSKTEYQATPQGMPTCTGSKTDAQATPAGSSTFTEATPTGPQTVATPMEPKSLLKDDDVIPVSTCVVPEN